GDRGARTICYGRSQRPVCSVRGRRSARAAGAIHRRGLARPARLSGGTGDDEARRYITESTMKIRFDQAAPYEVEETDVPFARAEGQELQARIYRPRGEADIPLAALVDVHGGAWSRGDRLTGAFHGRALAASGLLVVSLDFRQGSEAKHPAASADIAAGARYVRANAQRLGVDPRRIGIVGSSSGGQLALLAGVKPGAPEHAGTPIVRAGGSVERVHFPGARDGFIGQPGADADKAIALMRDFIGRQLAR